MAKASKHDKLKIPSGTQERESARIGKAVERLHRAERRMARAATAWMAARAALRALEKRADKALAKRIGGEYDPRELAELDEPPLGEGPGVKEIAADMEARGIRRGMPLAELDAYFR